MRRIMLAVAATTLTIPAMPSVAFAHGNDGYYNGRVWQDGRGRMRCKRPDGTTGLIIGAAGGALLGRAVDTKGERATGTIIGAAAGALLGRHVDRTRRVRCR